MNVITIVSSAVRLPCMDILSLQAKSLTVYGTFLCHLPLGRRLLVCDEALPPAGSYEYLIWPVAEMQKHFAWLLGVGNWSLLKTFLNLPVSKILLFFLILQWVVSLPSCIMPQGVILTDVNYFPSGKYNYYELVIAYKPGLSDFSVCPDLSASQVKCVLEWAQILPLFVIFIIMWKNSSCTPDALGYYN